jgi:hypothetical protein
MRDGFYIGSHPGMTDADIEYVGGVVRSALTSATG